MPYRSAAKRQHAAVQAEYEERMKALRKPTKQQLAMAMLDAVMAGSLRLEPWAASSIREAAREAEKKGFARHSVANVLRDMRARAEEAQRLHAVGGVRRAEDL
jgi:hypothetical protein